MNLSTTEQYPALAAAERAVQRVRSFHAARAEQIYRAQQRYLDAQIATESSSLWGGGGPYGMREHTDMYSTDGMLENVLAEPVQYSKRRPQPAATQFVSAAAHRGVSGGDHYVYSGYDLPPEMAYAQQCEMTCHLPVYVPPSEGVCGASRRTCTSSQTALPSQYYFQHMGGSLSSGVSSDSMHVPRCAPHLCGRPFVPTKQQYSYLTSQYCVPINEFGTQQMVVDSSQLQQPPSMLAYRSPGRRVGKPSKIAHTKVKKRDYFCGWC